MKITTNSSFNSRWHFSDVPLPIYTFIKKSKERKKSVRFKECRETILNKLVHNSTGTATPNITMKNIRKKCPLFLPLITLICSFFFRLFSSELDYHCVFFCLRLHLGLSINIIKKFFRFRSFFLFPIWIYNFHLDLVRHF